MITLSSAFMNVFSISFCNLLVLHICVLVLNATVFDTVDNVSDRYYHDIFCICLTECAILSAIITCPWAF